MLMRKCEIGFGHWPIAIELPSWASLSLYMQAVKWRLLRRFRELVATFAEWTLYYLYTHM
jgi:hypothetical protein